MRFTLLASLVAALVGVGAAVASAQGSPTGGSGLGTSTTSTTTTTTTTVTAPPPPAPKGADPLKGRAMWIWELGSSDGGNVASIAATAHQYGISTVIVKSSDGTGMWSQFNRTLVQALHASGVHVCAWQYVYGNQPVIEAQLGAAAVSDGADCLVIDAEVEYEGKYAQAQTYMAALRRLVGYAYPVALAGFPYVDFHPAFPYSVFLGRGGAQYNAPQMYWADIGVTVDQVFAHTYTWNRPYDRPIYPLGQVYNGPPPRQIVRFREVSKAYGALGVSWWDWQEAPLREWRALSRPVSWIHGYTPAAGMVILQTGDAGDLVVWAQEHLVTAGDPVKIDGAFGPLTQTAVESFQLAHGLVVTGVVDTSTWIALLRYQPAHVKWTVPHKRRRKSAEVASAGQGTPPPWSASLPDVRDELAGAGGAGRPPGR
jgi:peptidoglycan hydrolase-like protein with peptidoglycan-binding domain